jgi:hypothetical protein
MVKPIITTAQTDKVWMDESISDEGMNVYYLIEQQISDKNHPL